MSEEYFEGISDQEINEAAREQIRNKYRLVFSGSPIGVEVLADILVNFCHFGCVLSSPEEVAKYNVGIFILGRMGIFSEGNGILVVQNLLNVLPNKEE